MPRDANGVWTPLPNPSAFLQRLYDERRQQIEFVDQTIAGANVEGQTRDLSPTEQETLNRSQERITAIDAQITPVEDFEQLRSAGDQAGSTYRPTVPAGQGSQSGTGQHGLGYTNPRAHEYRSAGHVIVDRLLAAPPEQGGYHDAAARERLLSAELTVPGETRAVANQTTVDTPGLLPKPIIGELVNDIDARRPFITSIGAKDMSDTPGKLFTRPVITQHVTVAEQVTEKTELSSTKMVIGGIDFTKKTYGGVVDISRQDIDWTSPSAWNALLQDLQDVYAKRTEIVAGTAFATSVTQQVERGGAVATPGTALEWATALYAAAVLAYSGAEELPDAVWSSLDMWAMMGPVLDTYVVGRKEIGSSSPSSFVGNILDLPRYVVPAFPAATMIVGVKRKVEFYEQRLGFLSAVEPALLGVTVAYGGYAANGTLDPTAFAKIVNLV